MNSLHLFQSYFRRQRSRPVDARYSIKSRRFWPSTSLNAIQDLNQYFHYDTTNINEGIFTMMKKCERPTVFDPIEIIFSGDRQGGLYRYTVTVEKFGEVLYTKASLTEEPWDVLKIKEDFIGETDLYNSLCKTTYPFSIRMKNDCWSFKDVLGTGVTRVIGTKYRSPFWTNNTRLLFESRIVYTWLDFRTLERAGPNLFISNLQTLMRMFLDGLLEARADYSREKTVNGVLPRKPDLGFMSEFIKEFEEVYQRIFSAKLQAHLLQNLEPAEMTAKLQQISDLFATCRRIGAVLAEVDKGKLVAALEELPAREAIKTIQSDFPETFNTLFNSPASIEQLAQANADIEKKVRGRLKELEEVQEEAQEKGLVWRCNLFFFGMIKRSMLNRILNSELPDFKCLNSVSRSESASTKDCYLRLEKYGYQIKLTELEVEWMQTDKPETLQRKAMPSRLVSSYFKVIHHYILFNSKTRGDRQWGYNLFMMDLERLKKTKSLETTLLKSYDLKLHFSAASDLVCLSYVKGFMPYICLFEKSQEGKFSETFVEKLRALLRTAVPPGDEDPGLESVRWKHLTICTGVSGRTVILQMTNYSTEATAVQRIYVFRYAEGQVRLVVSRYSKFASSYFKGRRVEPKHLAIFTKNKVPFIMISSDRLNFDLTILNEDKLVTVMSWMKPKRLLLGWKRVGGIESISSSWDSSHDTLILYGNKSSPQGGILGTVIMRLSLIF